MFSAMFSGKYSMEPNKDGAFLFPFLKLNLQFCQGSYFIDRDGTTFRWILNYLRDRECVLPKDKQTLRELLIEARYYCIHLLKREGWGWGDESF